MEKLLCMTIFLSMNVYSWSGKDSPADKNVNFYGTIETHEGQRWNVQNIAFGKDRASARIKKIIMYDTPKEYTQDNDNKYVLTISPSEMTYSEIDLNEIDTIQVLQPSNRWIYKEDKKKYGIEYRDVMVTHKDGKKNSYLIELGREDIPHKVKLFCSIRHSHSLDNPKKSNQQLKVSTVKTDKEHSACDDITMDELEEKGIPIQAIKKITIEGFCHQVLVQ